jgi:ATP-dependent helicase HrpA
VATIEVDWLEKTGRRVVQAQLVGPALGKKSGKVIALERVSLFGLTIVAGRKVEYGQDQ